MLKDRAVFWHAICIVGFFSIFIKMAQSLHRQILLHIRQKYDKMVFGVNLFILAWSLHKNLPSNLLIKIR